MQLYINFMESLKCIYYINFDNYSFLFRTRGRGVNIWYGLCMIIANVAYGLACTIYVYLFISCF